MGGWMQGGGCLVLLIGMWTELIIAICCSLLLTPYRAIQTQYSPPSGSATHITQRPERWKTWQNGPIIQTTLSTWGEKEKPLWFSNRYSFEENYDNNLNCKLLSGPKQKTSTILKVYTYYSYLKYPLCLIPQFSSIKQIRVSFSCLMPLYLNAN